MKGDVRQWEEANVPGSHQLVAAGLALAAEMGTMSGRKGDKQPGNTRGTAEQKATRKQRESCKARKQTSLHFGTGGMPVSERKPSGNVRVGVQVVKVPWGSRKTTLAKGSLFGKSLGQWRLVHGMEEPGYPVTQTISQREMLEKAGIMHVKPGDQWPFSDTQSGIKKNKGGAGFPTSAKQGEGQKEPHQLGQKQIHMEDNQLSKWIMQIK